MITRRLTHFGNYRSFHSSSSCLKKFYDIVIPTSEATKPIPFASNVQIKVMRLPPADFPPQCPHGRYSYEELTMYKVELRRFRESSVFYKQMAANTAVVEVRGPQGTGYITIPEWIDLKVSNSPKSSDNGDYKEIDIWHGQGVLGGQMDDKPNVKAVDDFLPPSNDGDRYLHVSCVDPVHPLQSRHWGFYRHRIADYVQNVSDMFTMPVKLVGVGYRATVEDMKLMGPEKTGDVVMFEKFVSKWLNLAGHDLYRSYIAKTFPDSLWAQVHQMKLLLNHNVNKHFKTVYSSDNKVDPSKLQYPKKLVLKLGFSHSIELPIPPFINVTTPSPTKIMISSPHARQVKEFAQLIRTCRPPEPYKGKGVFVNDETITLKSKKLK